MPRVRQMLLASDQGLAMPMVLMVFLVSIALVAALLTSIYGSSRVSGTVGQAIQSEAAAEAGLDAMIGAIKGQNPCRGLPAEVSAVEPKYSAEIDCSKAMSSYRVTITSTGTASDGSKQRIEAVYPYTPQNAPSWLEMQNNVTLKGKSGIKNHPKQPMSDIATMFLRDGEFSCTTSASVFQANIILDGGNAIVKNCGEITGDVWATGTITDGRNNITGAKYHPGTDPNHPIMKRPEFKPITKARPSPAPVRPSDIGSYFEQQLTATNSPSAIRNAIKNNKSKPGLLDLTGKGVVTLDGTVEISQDFVILGDSFQLAKGTQFNGGSGDIKRFWLVVPTPERCVGVPGMCVIPAGTGSINVGAQGNGVSFDGNAVGMLYTNGLTNITNQGNAPWSGTIYSGEFDMPDNPNNQFLEYFAMPLPGQNLTQSNPLDMRLGALMYQRNCPVTARTGCE